MDDGGKSKEVSRYIEQNDNCIVRLILYAGTLIPTNYFSLSEGPGLCGDFSFWMHHIIAIPLRKI